MQKIEIKHWNPDPSHPVDLALKLAEYSENSSMPGNYLGGPTDVSDDKFADTEHELKDKQFASTSTYKHGGNSFDRVSINTFSSSKGFSKDGIAQAMQETIAALAKTTKSQTSSSTLNWCAQVGRTVVTANVGKTRAYLMVKEGDKFVARPLNWPQKPDDHYESSRFRFISKMHSSTRIVGSSSYRLSSAPEITTVEVPAGVEAYVVQIGQPHTKENRIELSDAYIARFFNEHGMDQNAARQLVAEAVRCGADKDVIATIMPIVDNKNQVTVASMAEGRMGSDTSDRIDSEVVFSLRSKLLGQKTLDELASDKRSIAAMANYKKVMRQELKKNAGNDAKTKKMFEIHDTVLESLEKYNNADKDTDVEKISAELKEKLDKLTPSSALRKAIYILVSAIIGALIGALIGAALTGGFGLLPGAVIGAKSSVATVTGAVAGATFFCGLSAYGVATRTESEVPTAAYDVARGMNGTMA